jgi:hypothetical protein
MIIKNNVSKASIEDFRDHVSRGLGPASEVLFNVIDVLAIGLLANKPFKAKDRYSRDEAYDIEYSSFKWIVGTPYVIFEMMAALKVSNSLSVH